jgi:hypothetical protein
MSQAPKGRAVIEMLLDTNQLTKSLRKVEDNFKKVGANILKVGAGFTAFGAALVAPLIAATKSFVEFGDTVDKISARTGASAEFISALGFAAEQSGADMATLEKAIIGQQRTLNDMNQGLKTAIDAYKALGLTAKDFEGLNTEESFLKIAQKLSEIEDPSLKAATALEIFGKAGQKLIPLISGGEAGIKAFIKEADKLGIILSPEEAEKAAELTDSVNSAKRALEGLEIQFGVALADQFKKIVDEIANYIVKAQQFIKENKGLIKSTLQLGAGIATIGAIVSTIGVSFIAAGFAIGGFSSVLALVTASVSTFSAVVLTLGGALFAGLISPLGLVTVALASVLLLTDNLSSSISDLADSAKNDLSGAFKDAKDNFDSLRSAVLAGDLKLAFNILAKSIKLFFLDAFKGITNGFAEWVALTNSSLNNVATSFQQAFLFIKQLWVKLRLVFSETSDSLAEAFLSPMATLENLFIGITTRIKLLWLDIKGLIEGGIKFTSGDISGAKQTFDDLLIERDKIQKESEKEIESNLKFGFGEIESDLSKQLKKDIDGIAKEIDRLEKGALDFTLAAFAVADDAKADTDQSIKDAKQELKFLGLVAKQTAIKQQEANKTTKDIGKDSANAIKSLMPKFGALVETGSGRAFKLFGTQNNPLVKEQIKTNKTLLVIANNTEGLTVK